MNRQLKVYLIGSLRNPRIPQIANELRQNGLSVFDDWFAAGPEADDYWKKYERMRGRDLTEALHGKAAKHVHDFDDQHLLEADIVVLVTPCGRSGHLELGISIGRGKKAYILLDGDPDRWDIMYRYAHGVFTTVTDLTRMIGRLG